MCSLLWFMLCCFVLEILNKAYFICKMLEWPSINQMLQALSFTLYLNFINSFKTSCTNAPEPSLSIKYISKSADSLQQHVQGHRKRRSTVL